MRKVKVGGTKNMIGLYHFIIIGAGCLGLILGGFLIDLDHGGTVGRLWDGFWNVHEESAPEENFGRGIFHHPLVAWSIIAFCTCLALGYTIHMLADNIKYLY